MSDSKKIDLLTIIVLICFSISGFYSLHVDRFLYWFPEWFLQSMQKGIAFDIPRYSFSFFQIPSFLLSFFNFDEYLRLKTIGIGLTLFPIISLYFCWSFLKRSPHKGFLYPILLSFLIFYFPTSAPSFNGALHSFCLFWVLASLLIGNYAGKLRILFLILYIVFIFFYPPASFTGSLLLLFHYKKYKNGSDYNFYALIMGSALSFAYIIFFKFFSHYPIYTETLLGIRSIFLTPLSLLFYLFIYYLIRFNFSEVKRFSYQLMFILFLAFYIYEGWNITLLSGQYHYRIFLYTLGFSPILFLDKFSSKNFISQKILNSFAVLVVFVFLTDIRSTFLFQRDISLLEGLAKTNDTDAKCITIERPTSLISNYDDINSLSYLVQKISQTNTVLMPKDSYTNQLFNKICIP